MEMQNELDILRDVSERLKSAPDYLISRAQTLGVGKLLKEVQEHDE